MMCHYSNVQFQGQRVKEELRNISHYTHNPTGLIADLSVRGFLRVARDCSLPTTSEPVLVPPEPPA